ncbi:MAG: hypothetical protein HFJ86_01200 [Oscillospiraceae bacterium]|nr:hypothetical protein [Oscillospiraceae bacterium]
MNRFARRAGVLLLALLILAYLIFQISRGFTQSHVTEVALSYVAADSAPASCLLIRNETVLDQGQGGVVEHLFPDGQKVSKNEVVANIYNSETQVRNKTRITDLQAEIAVLNSSGDMSSTGLIQADLLAKQLNQQMTELAGLLEQGNAKGVNSVRYNLQISLNKKKAITDQTVDFSARLESLTREAQSLSQSGITSVASIAAPVSGYYAGSIDGYESILTEKTLETLDLQTVQSILGSPDPQSSSRSCKILSGLGWYCAAVGDISLEPRLYNNMRVDIVFPFSTQEVPGRLLSYQAYPDEGKVLMVFRCTYMSEELATARKSLADITFRSYSGIRVRQEAIRFDKENNEGVYVKVGEKVVFKKLDVLYRGDGFVLSNARDDSETQYLKLFDEIIVEGKDLYDGKILQ